MTEPIGSINISCPTCGTAISPKDMNIQSVIAKCSKCGIVFGFADRVPNAQAAYHKPTVAMPARFSLTRESTAMIISYKWFSARFLFLLFFCVFWDGFLVVWYSIALTSGAPLAMILFPIIHVCVGVCLTYATLTGFINSTIIRVGKREISVQHVPLPWPGNKILRRENLEQFFCEENAHRSNRGNTTYTYSVSIVMRGGSRTKLVSSLESPEQALFIERQIENCLGIKDQAVIGEMHGM